MRARYAYVWNVQRKALLLDFDKASMTIPPTASPRTTPTVAIDPVSTLSSAGNELTAHSVAERLIDWSKAESVTLGASS